MASHNITITYPDGQATRIMAALKKQYTTTAADGTQVVPTNAQVLVFLQKELSERVKSIVIDIERRVAADAVVTVDVT